MPQLKRTTGAGDFGADIWTPAGTPASGDFLHINHAVTWQPATGTYWIGSGTEIAMSFGSAGSLALTPAGPITLNICGSVASGNVSGPEFTVNSISGTVDINFDGTASAAGFTIEVGNTYSSTNRGGWNLIGNATYPINVQSLPADGTKNSNFGGTQAGSCNINANYVNFKRIGKSTTRAFTPNMTQSRNPNIYVQNTVFSSCGEYYFNSDATYTGVVEFRNVKWLDPIVDNSSYYALTLNFGNNSGVRLFSGCSIPTPIKMVVPWGVLFEGCLLESGYAFTHTAARWTGINRSLLHCMGAFTANPMIGCGDVTNTICFWDNPTTLNHHFISQTTSATSGSYTLYSGNFFYTNSLGSDGNCMLTTGTPNRIDVVNNVVLPNASGTSSGALFTAGGQVDGTGIINIRNNTANVAGQWGLETGHLLGTAINGATNAGGLISISTNGAHNYATGDQITIADVIGVDAASGTWTITVTSPTTYTLNGSTFSGSYISGGFNWKREAVNRYADISANIFWGNGTGFAGADADTSSFVDIIPPSVIQKNCSFAIQSTKPSTTKWLNQANGWTARYSTTPGATDLTNTDPGFVNSGVSIANWAVLKGSASSTLANKERDALNYIRADLSLIDDLRNYLGSGYNVTNVALYNAGPNGQTIGARNYVSSFSARPRKFGIRNGSSLTSLIRTGGSLI